MQKLKLRLPPTYTGSAVYVVFRLLKTACNMVVAQCSSLFIFGLKQLTIVYNYIYRKILLIILNKVAPTTLLHPVLNN